MKLLVYILILLLVCLPVFLYIKAGNKISTGTGFILFFVGFIILSTIMNLIGIDLINEF